MHHYRCQHVYISTTVSDRTVDTLEFFPHHYQMTQLSSTYRLLMAAKYMMDALQNPHPDVPFTSVGDDTISALADLAALFKLKLQHAPPPESRASPAKVAPLPSLIPSSTQILTSPIPNRRQKISKTKFTLKTSQMCHYLRGWSHLGHYMNHHRGCPVAPSDSLPKTCRKMTSAEWTRPTWQLPLEINIGHNGTKPTLSSTQSPAKKWNTRLS
jgi:hypothetical protein